MPHLVQLGPVPPPEGGVARNLLAIHFEARARGWRSSIIATTRAARIEQADDVYRPGDPIELTKILRSLRADLVHLHIGGEVTGRVLALAGVVSVAGGSNSVLTVHSGGFQNERARPMTVRGSVFRHYSHIISVSDRLDEVIAGYGVDERCRSVISPFVPVALDPNVLLRPELESFIRVRTHIFVNIGGLEPEYDPLFQLEVFGKLKDRLPDAGLIIVGSGSMDSIVREAMDASDAAKDIFLAGNLPHAETLRLLSESSVVMRTTTFDGDAISVREAMYLGKPVVASDVAARPSGTVTYPAGDLDGCVEAVEKAMKVDLRDQAVPDPRTNIDPIFNIYEALIKTP